MGCQQYQSCLFILVIFSVALDVRRINKSTVLSNTIASLSMSARLNRIRSAGQGVRSLMKWKFTVRQSCAEGNLIVSMPNDRAATTPKFH